MNTNTAKQKGYITLLAGVIIFLVLLGLITFRVFVGNNRVNKPVPTTQKPAPASQNQQSTNENQSTTAPSPSVASPPQTQGAGQRTTVTQPRNAQPEDDD